jgi:hypothetical protein
MSFRDRNDRPHRGARIENAARAAPEALWPPAISGLMGALPDLLEDAENLIPPMMRILPVLRTPMKNDAYELRKPIREAASCCRNDA